MSAPDFRAVYRRYYRLVWWVVQGSGVPESWREDVVQDAFVAIHRRLPERDPADALRPWVIGLARNAAFSHRRGAARRQARHAAVPTPETPTAVDSAVAYRHAWDQVHHFLDELDQDQREAFVLCELEGLPPAEVASTLRVSRNTVYSRLRLARGKLVDHFSERPRKQLPGLLRAARKQGGPTPEHKRRTWAALAMHLPLAGPAAIGSTAAVGATSSVSTGLSAVAISLVLAATGVGAVAVGARVLGPSDSTESTSPAVARSDATERRRESTPNPDPDPASSRLADTRPAAAPSAPNTTLANPAPRHPAASRPKASASTRPEPTKNPSLDEELALLQLAHQKLEAHDHRGALAVLDRHAREYPGSALATERVGLRVRAHCADGDAQGAKAIADRYIARHPSTRLAATLAEPCAKQ